MKGLLGRMTRQSLVRIPLRAGNFSFSEPVQPAAFTTTPPPPHFSRDRLWLIGGPVIFLLSRLALPCRQNPLHQFLFMFAKFFKNICILIYLSVFYLDFFIFTFKLKLYIKNNLPSYLREIMCRGRKNI